MKWEYLVERFDQFHSLQEMQDTLNKIGDNGWEVATTAEINSFDKFKRAIVIFKRQKDGNKE